ncbi:MAG: ribose 5-phosphate isomerase B [Acidobacteria bacterium]|nr:ribose 5-phosphate isomerase B [Acidobacteriota bacterium]
MKIAIGSDHAGYEVKETVKQILDEMGLEYEDFGTYSAESVDYPDFAGRVAEAVAQGQAVRGLLVCGSGIGMSIVANKFPGVRAAVCHNVETARLSREHNDANVLAIGARTTPIKTINEMVRTFFNTEFVGGRHTRRLEKIEELEDRWANNQMTSEKIQ